MLRDGALVAHGPRTDFDAARLITLMVGRSLNQLYPARAGWAPPLPAPPGRPLLEVCGLTQPGMVRDLSFHPARREGPGLFGLMGADRSEPARMVFGLDPYRRDTVRLVGQPWRSIQPHGCLRRSLCGGLGGAVAVAQIGSVTLRSAQTRNAPSSPRPCRAARACSAGTAGSGLAGGSARCSFRAIESGHNHLNADPYLYLLGTRGIIFVAMLLDSVRGRLRRAPGRRRIQPD